MRATPRTRGGRGHFRAGPAGMRRALSTPLLIQESMYSPLVAGARSRPAGQGRGGAGPRNHTSSPPRPRLFFFLFRFEVGAQPPPPFPPTPQVGTEHVLLGLIAEEPPSKAGYMGTGITVEAARSGVAAMAGRGRKVSGALGVGGEGGQNFFFRFCPCPRRWGGPAFGGRAGPPPPRPPRLSRVRQGLGAV